MNLKDRMSSGFQPSKPQETSQSMNSDSTMLKSNPQLQDSILQKQSETIQKQEREIQQLTSTISDIQSQTDSIMLELDLLKKQGRPSDVKAIQILSSEKSELKSAIADLRAELSSVQKINQSLTQSNDDLRNNAGLKSLKEQKQLEAKCHTLMVGNSELERMVNMSNVEAVQAAQAAQKTAEQKAKQDILACKAEARGKVYTATMEKNSAIKDARKRVHIAEKSQRMAWESLIFTLFCCLIAHPTCLSDIGCFVWTPIIWLWNTSNIYAEWIQRPYYLKIVGTIERTYPFSTTWAWILRIMSLLILPICAFCICCGVHGLCLYYRKRWCLLSLRILLVSIIIIVVFCEEIHKYIDINLVLLLIIIQSAYLIVLGCLDKYCESRSRVDDWKRLQNV